MQYGAPWTQEAKNQEKGERTSQIRAKVRGKVAAISLWPRVSHVFPHIPSSSVRGALSIIPTPVRIGCKTTLKAEGR
jgi:hypothetical protein